MPDPTNDTGYTENQKFPEAAREASREPADDDNIERRIIRKTPFPVLMLITGVLWILAGAAYLALFGLFRLLDMPMRTNELWLIVGAIFFIKDGIQLIRGTFRDPQMDGIFSVLIGLFFYGMGYYRFEQAEGVVALIVAIFFGSIFLIPGILVLIGRTQYLAWLAEQEEQAPESEA